MTQKVAVVTAASKGMGAACATELAQRGYDMVLMSRSDAVLELVKNLQGMGMQGNVMNPADLERVVSAALQRFGRIDKRDRKNRGVLALGPCRLYHRAKYLR
jgi:NADP-dependent 3-hydroxy acid dehydrogenase YdfG